MEDQEMQARRVVRLIEEAFADLPYPGDNNIATNPDHCDECEYTDEFFKGRYWRDLTHTQEKLPTGWGGLSFLTPEAWRFYMPAYMIRGLGEGEYVGDFAACAFHFLAQPEEADLRDHFMERAMGFSAEQRQSIRAFVGELRARTDHYPEDIFGKEFQQLLDFYCV